MVIDSFTPRRASNAHVGWKKRRSAMLTAVWFISLAFVSLIFGYFMMWVSADFEPVAWVIFLGCLIAIVAQPRYGVYTAVFFTLIADNKTMYWYPFVKNFSSGESIFYLGGAFIISPLELVLIVTLLSWLGRVLVTRKMVIHFTPLFISALVFTGFVAFGLAYGILRGGNLNIALWEARAIFYLPLLIILTSNLLQTRAHLNQLIWFAMASLFVEGLMGSYYFFVTLEMDLGIIEAMTEHSAAIHMNTLFVFVMAAWLYRASFAKRVLPFLMIPPVLLTYLAAQRRAAFVAIIIAMIFMAFILLKENKAVFFFIVPPIAAIGVVYVLAFWNNTGAIGMGAQAVKSIIAEDQASLKDQQSNLYREIENINSLFTISNRPLTGVGFGQKFLILVTMPDISFFEWWEYITHNSVVWIWMKTGVGGFVSMLYLIGLSLMAGSRALWRMPTGDLRAIALTATLYIIMHFVYAYVDMSWEAQSMVYIGSMMGLLSAMERIVDIPEPVLAKRWPWQKEPKPAPGLLPAPGIIDIK